MACKIGGDCGRGKKPNERSPLGEDHQYGYGWPAGAVKSLAMHAHTSSPPLEKATLCRR